MHPEILKKVILYSLMKFYFSHNNSFLLGNKHIRTRKHKPWITTGFRNSIRTKHKLYMYYLKKATVYNEINYKRYRNQLNYPITVAERDQSIIGRKEIFLSNDELLIDGKLTKNKKCIADKFNEYFFKYRSRAG